MRNILFIPEYFIFLKFFNMKCQDIEIFHIPSFAEKLILKQKFKEKGQRELIDVI